MDAAHHARKHAAGTSTMNALGHYMRKPLSLASLWRYGQGFHLPWGLET